MSTGELPTQLTEQLKTFVRLRPVQLTQPPSVVPCSTNKHDLLIERAPAKAGASREPPQRFRYTHVFPEDTSQEDFFRETTLPLVRDMFTGTNTLFFAYGVSGGGKTFTLDGSASQPGVIPRALSAIFQTIGDYQTEVPVKPAHFDGIELFDAHDRAEKESAGILAAALASSSRSTIGATPSTPRRGLARNVSHLLPLAIPGSDLYSSELAESLCLGDTYSDDLQALAAVESTRFSVWVSACQIYNRVISDLLVEPATDGRLSSFGVPSTPGGGDRRRTGSTFPLATPSTPSTSSAATAAAAAASGSFPFGSSFGVTGMPGGTRVSTAPAPGAGGGAGGGGFGCPVGLGSGSSAPVVTDNGYIHGLVEVRVRSMREAFALIARAREHRARAATSQNVASSRSHSIYFIRVLQFPVAPGACSDTGSMAEVLVDPKAVRTSRLVLVDMAGAERSKKLNHSSAERQRESNRINETVLHLNACLEALRNKQSGGSSGFYSWSSDKLTKLFQPYFTGAGKAAMVLNVNPDPELVKETFHALQVGSVAQQLRTTRQRARPMVDIHDPTLARLPSSFQSYQAPFMDSGGSYLTALSGSQTPTVQAVKRSRATPTLEQAQNTYSARAMRYHMKHGREAATTPIRIVGGRTGQVAASAGGSPRLLLEHPWDLAHGTGNVGTGTPLRAGSSPGGALDITLAGPLATPRRWARPDPLRTPGSGPALPLMHGDDEEEDVVLLPDALIARDSERLLGSIAAEIASLKQRAEACRDCAARAIASAQSIDIENAVNEAKAELMGQALLQRDSLARSASEVETSGGADAPNSVALALMQDKAQLENALYEARLAADAADQRAYSTVHAYADRLRQAFVESDRLSSENRKLREELSRLRSILSNSGAAPGSPSRGSPAPADQPSGSTPDRGYHSPTGQAPLLEEEALSVTASPLFPPAAAAAATSSSSSSSLMAPSSSSLASSSPSPSPSSPSSPRSPKEPAKPMATDEPSVETASAHSSTLDFSPGDEGFVDAADFHCEPTSPSPTGMSVSDTPVAAGGWPVALSNKQADLTLTDSPSEGGDMLVDAVGEAPVSPVPSSPDPPSGPTPSWAVAPSSPASGGEGVDSLATRTAGSPPRTPSRAEGAIKEECSPDGGTASAKQGSSISTLRPKRVMLRKRTVDMTASSLDATPSPGARKTATKSAAALAAAAAAEIGPAGPAILFTAGRI